MATILEAPSTVQHQPEPVPRQRSMVSRVLQVLRRSHLYLGLALFPWAILYGVTAFLFNHRDPTSGTRRNVE
jgi:hypothetical protein